MSTFSSSAAVSGSDPSMMASDANFDSFIDSDLIMDVNSPAPSPVTPNASSKKEHKAKPSSLSALPSRLVPHVMDRHSPSSPGAAMHDYLQYPHSSPSTVTTPTTSNSSSLHNLSFDFLDGGDGADGAGSTGNDASEAMSPDADMTNMSTPSAATFSASTPSATTAPSIVNALGSTVSLGGMQHAFQRTVDDMGHQPGHQQAAHHHAHHQRSLSLRDMNESAHMVGGGMPTFPMMQHDAFASFNFPNVNLKMEMDMMHQTGFGGMPLQIPFHEQSDVNGQNGETTAPKGKKRRLTADGKSTDGKKETKAAAGKKSSNASRRSRANTTPAKKDAKTGNPAAAVEEGPDLASMLVTSLIENVPSGAGDASAGSMTFAMPVAGSVKEEYSGNEGNCSLLAPSSRAASEEMEESGDDEDEVRKPKAKGNKRPPPSASQITESGLPFPVIDTSAKHSSLFIPPDTSGLTKREARLVKNRAAAFLSRQRKREQFEELDIKCRALCRLVWKMWELGTGKGVTGGASKVAALFSNQPRMSDVLLQEEGAEVQEVFDTVLTLKGGSVAPTEDGQLQGAVEAGIMSANGKIMGDVSSVVHVPSKAARAAEEAAKELAKLRAELEESKKRESALQSEIAHERAARLKSEFEAQQRMQEQQPFRGGGKHDLSLTVPATFDEDDEDAEEEADEARSDVGNTSANGQRKGRAARPSRASQRLQRQGQPSSAATPAAVSSVAGGQRKAAGAALMMVLFSFALFGLPGGQNGRVGGVTRVPGSSDEFPLGRVLGAPISGSNYVGGEDEDEAVDGDVNSHLPPSSHLSVNDLFPPAHEMQDLLSAAAAASAVGEDDASGSKNRLSNSLRDVFGGSRTSNSAGDFSVDYKAFAKDLGSSLDWDMQGGFLVLGGDGDEENGASAAATGIGKGAKDGSDINVDDADQQDKAASELKDAPTKLTLFVPAPDMSNSPESDTVEDFFYDAPLAGADANNTDSTLGEEGRTTGDRTQAEATRAALQVLRNHRVAREAAAFAASRRLSKQPSPSQRVRSPVLSRSSLSSTKPDGTNGSDKQYAEDDVTGEDGEDFINEVMDASRSAADRIRGTDFYQLEFSLSRAKVRNVAELARLFGSMRSKSD